MDKQKVYEECMGYAKDFVKQYLVADVCAITKDGYIVLSDMARYIPINYHYEIYEDLHRFIALAVNGKYGTISLWRLKGSTLASKLCLTLVPLLDECKDPKDYQHIIRIIFCMIRNSIYSKNEFVDALKDTMNTPALLEIIKYDDFTVMTDNHRKERFEL